MYKNIYLNSNVNCYMKWISSTIINLKKRFLKNYSFVKCKQSYGKIWRNETSY